LAPGLTHGFQERLETPTGHPGRHPPDSGAVEDHLPSHRGTPQWNWGATSLVRSQSFWLFASWVRCSP